jgi:hypothetical protein
VLYQAEPRPDYSPLLKVYRQQTGFDLRILSPAQEFRRRQQFRVINRRCDAILSEKRVPDASRLASKN